MTVVNHATGEILDVPAALTADQARELTDRIRQTLHVGHDLIVEAFRGAAWSALGYQTWDAYCAGEFAGARMVRLDREQRREIVAEMRRGGMSTPAIGSALGVSDETARRDLMGSPHGVELPPVRRTDGVQRTTPVAPPRPVPSAPPRDHRRAADATPAIPGKRRPLGDAFADATYDLTKTTERLERLCADDRFPHNAEQVATKNRGDLLRAAEALAGVLSRLS